MIQKLIYTIYCLALTILPTIINAQELYKMPEKTETRWISFENQTGARGNGGKENKGAKGHPADQIVGGETKELMNIKGCGLIQRMWLTIDDRSPAMLRSLRLDMYWDGNSKPAVSVPLGDFFGVSLGRRLPFETALFSDPEGRSFNFTIPMPYRTGARITLTNESPKTITLFYDIAFQQVPSHGNDVLYFHAHWNRILKTELGKDFEILPRIKGRGRYLGTNMGIITNPLYEKSWWGEGEVKIFLDGDTSHPTLNGTGTEDYIGTAWGQGVFNHMFQGCLVADENSRQWAFYRYHIPDPVFFRSECMVTIQIMGGDMTEKVRQYVKNGATLKPVTVSGKEFIKLFELSPVPDLMNENFPEGWTNFFRQDDVSATAYFYLDTPTSTLPPLPSRENRVAELPEKY